MNYHVCADYEIEDDHVFIDTKDRFKSIPKADLKESDSVVTCSKCNRPAVIVDYLYPYFNDRNRCFIHKRG